MWKKNATHTFTQSDQNLTPGVYMIPDMAKKDLVDVVKAEDLGDYPSLPTKTQSNPLVPENRDLFG